MNVVRRQSGFTLIELLVVISILGILAALTVPALKNLGKSNITVSAGRQLLDDVGRARQLAISQHTTVYMVFVTTNFWEPNGGFTTNFMTPQEMTYLYNLADKQLTSYTFISYGALGDQPGNHQWHILAPWQTLPDNSFIASWKFLPANNITYVGVNGQFPVHGFNSSSSLIPFPPGWSGATYPPLPFIAFNYLGQLTVDGVNPSLVDEYIPLAQGTVGYPTDPTSKAPLMYAITPNEIQENPPGNSTNSMFNLVHIDALTGRARLEFQQVQ